MKRKIEQAFAHQTPDVLNGVLSACETEKGEPIMNSKDWHCVTPRRRRKAFRFGIAATAAVLALAAGIGFAVKSGIKTPEKAPGSMQTSHSTCEFSEDTIRQSEPAEPEEPEETDTSEPVLTVGELVADYGIAPARAKLIAHALNSNSEYTVEKLMRMDTENLLCLVDSLDAGQPQEEYPITREQVRQIVTQSIQSETFRNYECELTDGCYEVQFSAGDLAYFYRVDATTGGILLSREVEDTQYAEENAAVKAALRFMEDLTPVLFMREDRDLTKHLVSADEEIWANALYYLPFGTQRYYFEEFWLTNQSRYVLEFAQYWNDVRDGVVYQSADVNYRVSNVNIVGNFAQIYLTEEKTFYYPDGTRSLPDEHSYEIMLTDRDGTWKIFDLTCDTVTQPQKYPDGQPQPPLVSGVYSNSYIASDGQTWTISLPQVMLNSTYAHQINAEIAEWYESHRIWHPEGIASGQAYEYEWSVYGDLLTLYIKHTTTYEPNEHYTVHTLRISDGGKATKGEILAAAAVSEEVLSEKALDLIANTFGTSFGGETMCESASGIPSREPTVDNTRLQYVFGKSVSRENIDDMVLFLNPDGKLCFCAKIYQYAGADYHERIWSIDDLPEDSPCYDILMEYSVGYEFPIDMYYCYEAVKAAFAETDTELEDVTDLQCFATFYTEGGSFYKICFTLKDVPYTYYFTTDTTQSFEICS